MSKFNNAYERLHYKWEYGADGRVGLDGWWNDYNVEKQQDDWFTLNEEYTKLSKALDKACHKLWIAEGMMFKEHSKTKEQWKEWLLKDE